MAFVNEYFTGSDIMKYGINEIDLKAPGTVVSSHSWTIDRARDIYLRRTSDGYRDDPSSSTWSWWTLYWKGELLWLKLEALGMAKKEADGLRHAHALITEFKIPEHLAAHEEEIRQDLREAFLAYGAGGVFFTSTTDFVNNIEFAD